MNAFRENLKTYLEIEKILNEFFNEFNYCIINCVPKEPETALRSARRGCCSDKYYKLHNIEHPAFELLRQEREKNSTENPRTWKTPKGPVLANIIHRRVAG